MKTSFFLVTLLLSARFASAAYLPGVYLSADTNVADAGKLRAVIEFQGNSGEPTQQHEFVGRTKADIDAQARAFLDQLNQALVDAAAVKAGDAVPAIVPPPPPQPPDPVVQAQTALQQAQTTYTQVAVLFNLGGADQTLLDAALANVQAATKLVIVALTTSVTAAAQAITNLGGTVNAKPDPLPTPVITAASVAVTP